MFGLEMVEESGRCGCPTGPGTLDPMLHGLHKARCLCSVQVVVNGKRRKYYVATATGRRALEQARGKVRELTREVLGEQTGKWCGQIRMHWSRGANNAASYGNYFRMIGAEPYTITIRVRRPQAPGTIVTRFDFKR